MHIPLWYWFRFWSDYCEIEPIELDTKTICDDWISAREAITKLLEVKQSAPLERINLEGDTKILVNALLKHCSEVETLNQMLIKSNQAILQVKDKAQHADVEKANKHLSLLKIIKSRYSDQIEPLCYAYLQEKQSKAVAEKHRDEARKALEIYRETIFPALEKGVNEYLDKFNAGFRISSLKPTNLGGGSGANCTYNVVINNSAIPVRNASKEEGKLSFRNTLSSGDRSTLALALFFSTLDQNPNLENTIVVMDDPMSSLDDHRSFATVQTVRRIAVRARQVVVLSHNKPFLCQVWNGADPKECSGLEIVDGGHVSNIVTLDISEDAVTEHDRRHTLMRGFLDSGQGDRREIAIAIRPHLEGFLRVACPAEFPPKPIPKWDVHFGGLEDDRYDFVASRIAFRP